MKAAGRAHQPPEDARLVAGMEHHEAHPAQHSRLDPVDDRIAHLVVGDVAPPHEGIRRGEHLVRQAVLGVGERRCPDGSPPSGAMPVAMAPWMPSG